MPLALVAGIVAGLSHPLVERVSDLLIGLGRRVLVEHRRPHAVVAHPRFRSARLTPACAARVFPVCRRSWKCSPGRPIAATASDQPEALRKLPRLSTPPRWPVNTSAVLSDLA